jgi:hypothetical protein
MDPEQDATEISQKFTGKDFPEFAVQTSALLVLPPAILFAWGSFCFGSGPGLGGRLDRRRRERPNAKPSRAAFAYKMRRKGMRRTARTLMRSVRPMLRCRDG